MEYSELFMPNNNQTIDLFTDLTSCKYYIESSVCFLYAVEALLQLVLLYILEQKSRIMQVCLQNFKNACMNLIIHAHPALTTIRDNQ